MGQRIESPGICVSLQNTLRLISINFAPKDSHGCLKKTVRHTMFSRSVLIVTIESFDHLSLLQNTLKRVVEEFEGFRMDLLVFQKENTCRCFGSRFPNVAFFVDFIANVTCFKEHYL